MNCKNCGALLTSYGVCEYCGTIYDKCLFSSSVNIECKDKKMLGEYVAYQLDADKIKAGILGSEV